MHTFPRSKVSFIAALLLASLILPATAEKPRVVILSDISNEPDDQMSFVRLFTYADVLDLEGLIAVTGCWRMTNPDTATLRKVVDAYGKVFDNLKLHSPGYPTAGYLRGIVKAGVNGFGMNAAAKQLDNEGVNHIVSVLEKDDPRPVWFCIWGGANTLGGAVMKIKNEKPADVEKLIAKIRTYDIALQDDGSAYIAHEFPSAQLMASRSAWKGISHSRPGWNDSPESWGGNDSVFSSAWCAANVQQGHGSLGEMYPNVMWRWEGDSPSFLYLVPNGLNFPQYKSYGGWGGRFGEERQLNVRSGSQNDSVDPILNNHKEYRLFTEAKDTWQYKNTTYTNNEYCAVFRWRDDFQNDFAARMDRCVNPFTDVNHAPRGAVNGDTTLDIVTVKTNPGAQLRLDASNSADPDGDSLSYSWFVYKEPGAYSGTVSVSDATSPKASVAVPPDAEGKTIHVLLRVLDRGAPPLAGYRRVVVTADSPTAAAARRIPGGPDAFDPVVRQGPGGALAVLLPREGDFVVRVSSLNGRLLIERHASGKNTVLVPLAGSAGTCVVSVARGKEGGCRNCYVARINAGSRNREKNITLF